MNYDTLNLKIYYYNNNNNNFNCNKIMNFVINVFYFQKNKYKMINLILLI